MEISKAEAMILLEKHSEFLHGLVKEILNGHTITVQELSGPIDRINKLYDLLVKLQA